MEAKLSILLLCAALFLTSGCRSIATGKEQAHAAKSEIPGGELLIEKEEYDAKEKLKSIIIPHVKFNGEPLDVVLATIEKEINQQTEAPIKVSIAKNQRLLLPLIPQGLDSTTREIVKQKVADIQKSFLETKPLKEPLPRFHIELNNVNAWDCLEAIAYISSRDLPGSFDIVETLDGNLEITRTFRIKVQTYPKPKIMDSFAKEMIQKQGSENLWELLKRSDSLWERQRYTSPERASSYLIILDQDRLLFAGLEKAQSDTEAILKSYIWGSEEEWLAMLRQSRNNTTFFKNNNIEALKEIVLGVAWNEIKEPSKSLNGNGDSGSPPYYPRFIWETSFGKLKILPNTKREVLINFLYRNGETFYAESQLYSVQTRKIPKATLERILKGFSQEDAKEVVKALNELSQQPLKAKQPVGMPLQHARAQAYGYDL